jgi:addiction module RelB/DinJ family antitoxin
MSSASLIQARIDPALKEKAENYFRAFGMDTATAIRIFFAKVAETGKIPFVIGLEPEDIYDSKLAEKAYEEYEKNSYESYPIENLYKKYGID